MIYANYILNKIKHLPKAVFASGFPLKLKSKFKRNALNYTIHGKTVNGKNILPYPYYETTVTKNGITFTDNGDGSITVNGTATANTNFQCSGLSSIPIPQGNYMLSSGVPDDDAKNTVGLAFGYKIGDEARTVLYTIDGQRTITLNETAICDVIIVIRANQTVNNLIFKPILELGNTATEYEPYTVYGVGDKTKNLIRYPYSDTTKTTNGVTFTDNGDGSITVNGTAIGDGAFEVLSRTSEALSAPEGVYRLSGTTNGTEKTYYLQAYIDNVYGQTDVRGGKYTLSSGQKINAITFYFKKDTVFNNVVFKPQLELGNIATDYEPYGYKIPLVNRGKNLANCEGITSVTAKGLTIEYLKNEDCFLINGTVTGTIAGVWVLKYLNTKINPGTYYSLSTNYVTGTIDKTNATTTHKYAVIYFGKNNTPGLSTNWLDCGLDMVNVAKENRVNDCNYITKMNFYIDSGITFDNYKVKIQLELGSSATDYEPYRVPDTTNVYHTAPLKGGESISYKADSLPELQLYKGENNITADTAVAPSAIDIKYLN